MHSSNQVNEQKSSIDLVDPIYPIADDIERQRKLRNEGDRYHVSACRCDFTNSCVDDDDEATMTLQTELFLCLTTELEGVEIVEISTLTLKGNGAELHPVVDGRPMDKKTWVTCDSRSCTIRTRLASEFFAEVIPWKKNIHVTAQGEVVLQKVNERKKKIKNKQPDPEANRFLHASPRNLSAVNVTTPFQVGIWTKPSTSPALTHSWVILVVAVLFVCVCNVFCEMSLEGRRRRQHVDKQHEQSLGKEKSRRAVSKKRSKRERKRNSFREELESAFAEDGFMDEISLMDSSVDNEKFSDELSSLDDSNSSKDRARIVRV